MLTSHKTYQARRSFRGGALQPYVIIFPSFLICGVATYFKSVEAGFTVALVGCAYLLLSWLSNGASIISFRGNSVSFGSSFGGVQGNFHLDEVSSFTHIDELNNPAIALHIHDGRSYTIGLAGFDQKDIDEILQRFEAVSA